MTRRLILMVVVLALGLVLVSPYAAADDAVHHRAHHHDLSWSVHHSGPALIVISDNSIASADDLPASLPLQLTALALRC